MLLLCLQGGPTHSQEGQHSERILVVDGQWRDTGVFSLSWQSKNALRSGAVDIHRRLLGERGGASWWPLAEGIRHRRVYVDETVKPGKAYEYRITRTDGDVHFATVNHGPWYFGDYQDAVDYYPMGNYLWRAPVWVNLLGDPTLRAFPLAPPAGLSSEVNSGTAILRWPTADAADVLGYQVWRLDMEIDRFEPISGLLKESHFKDTAWRPGYRYMVRSYGLKQVYAGSFYTWSQGVFCNPKP